MKIKFKKEPAPWDKEKKVKNLPPRTMKHGRDINSLSPMPTNEIPFNSWQTVCDEMREFF